MVHIPGLSRPFKTSSPKPPPSSSSNPHAQDQGTLSSKAEPGAEVILGDDVSSGRAVSLEREVDPSTVPSHHDVGTRRSTERTRSSSRSSAKTAVNRPKSSLEASRSSSSSPGPVSITKDRPVVGKRDRRRSTDTALSSPVAGETATKASGSDLTDDNKVSRHFTRSETTGSST